MIKTCSKCGKDVRFLALKEPPTCKNCYKRKQEICSLCGILGRVEYRSSTGEPVCHRCYKTPLIKCVICKKRNYSYKKCKGGYMCQKCYLKNYELPVEKCSVCNTESGVYKRMADKSPVCRKCYNKSYKPPVEICNLCFKEKPVNARREGKPLCKVCNYKWKFENDPKFYVKELIRARVKAAFKRFANGSKVQSSREYGIDYEKIFQHVGSCPGECGEFHIDHIFPLSTFDFSNPVQIAAAFAPENHRWMRSKDNLYKHAKYDKISFDIFRKEYGER